MDFTTILNKGIRRYIDKNVKKRKFGRCDDCDEYALLIIYFEDEQSEFDSLKLCESCYTKMLNKEE